MAEHQFEGYKQSKQQSNWDYEVYQADKKSKFFAPVGEPVESSQQVVQRFEEKYNNPEDFAERTKYYFQDDNIGYLKAERYQKMSEDEDSKVKYFAGAHTNRWACKRKMKAQEASDNFKTMAQKMYVYRKLSKKPDCTSTDKFALQEEVIKYRLKGMTAAAVVKGKSSEHEEYMKTKSKLSCSMVLLDQLDHLIAEEKNAKQLEVLNKKREALSKVVDNTREQLLKINM